MQRRILRMRNAKRFFYRSTDAMRKLEHANSQYLIFAAVNDARRRASIEGTDRWPTPNSDARGSDQPRSLRGDAVDLDDTKSKWSADVDVSE